MKGWMNMPSKERDWNVLRGLMGKVFDAEFEIEDEDFETAIGSIDALAGASDSDFDLSPEADAVVREMTDWAQSIVDNANEGTLLGLIESMKSWFWGEVDELAEKGVIEPHDQENDDYDWQIGKELFR